MVGLVLPDSGVDFALTALLGAVIGALVADVLLSLGPFARHRKIRLTAALGALIGASMAFGVFADRNWLSLLAAALVALPGALVYGWLSRKSGAFDSGAAGVLADDELGRGKLGSDRWVLVAGRAGSGKSALVRAMIGAARSRMDGPPRFAEDGDLRVSELPLTPDSGGFGKLRFWEVRSIEASWRKLPPLTDFDAVVLVVDPTQHRPIAGSFPPALRDGRESSDANDDVLMLADALRGGCAVWAVATKADLLRLSAHPPLVDSLPVGPQWYGRLRDMNLAERRSLAETLSLKQLLVEHRSAFGWGSASPLVAFAGDERGEAFGAPELLGALLETPLKMEVADGCASTGPDSGDRTDRP